MPVSCIRHRAAAGVATYDAFRKLIPASVQTFELLGRPDLRMANVASLGTRVVYWTGDADAVFKTAFARRSSRNFRSSVTRRQGSFVDRPGFAPVSIWACLTQPRNVSRLMPNCTETRVRRP